MRTNSYPFKWPKNDIYQEDFFGDSVINPFKHLMDSTKKKKHLMNSFFHLKVIVILILYNVLYVLRFGPIVLACSKSGLWTISSASMG